VISFFELTFLAIRSKPKESLLYLSQQLYNSLKHFFFFFFFVNFLGFSKGWKESFMSGDQEPWVFRGGLTADLQVMYQVDSLKLLHIM
jgi:hypothetical protein